MSPPSTPRPGPRRTPSRVRFGNLGFTTMDENGKEVEEEGEPLRELTAEGGLKSDPGTPNISE